MQDELAPVFFEIPGVNIYRADAVLVVRAALPPLVQLQPEHLLMSIHIH